MEEDRKETEERHEDAAKKGAPGGGGTISIDDKARIKELERENKDLRNQVLELQKRIDELEAESKAAANKSRAAKLVARLEKSGMTFASNEEREKELSRLAELSDDAFAATEAAYDKAIQSKSACSKPALSKVEGAADDDGKGKEKSNTSEADKQLRTDAGVRPLDVDDKKTSLEDKLKTGFMAAYQDRIGATQRN